MLSEWEGQADMQKREPVLGACISVAVTCTQPWKVGVTPIPQVGVCEPQEVQ